MSRSAIPVVLAGTTDIHGYIKDWRNTLFSTEEEAARKLGILRDQITYQERRTSNIDPGYLALLGQYVFFSSAKENKPEEIMQEIRHTLNQVLDILIRPRFHSWEELGRAADNFREGKGLTLAKLRNAGIAITDKNIEAFPSKYSAEVYLRRRRLDDIFGRFLKSTKRVFVLIGKSGAGKSSYVLSLRQALQPEKDISVLVYEASAVRLDEQSLTTLVGRDFAAALGKVIDQNNNVWEVINQLRGMDKHQVILLIDGINENPRARDILEQLDELARRQYGWLKIVITSRPETWRSIKRGLRLAQGLYYQEPGAGATSIALEPFSFSAQVEPFSEAELPDVYEKYRQAFNLLTTYADLAPAMRQTLSEPLSLYILARTYGGQSLPKTVRVTRLVEKYIQELEKRGSLTQPDLRFLRKDIVPLMIRGQQSTLTERDLDRAGLYESVFGTPSASIENLINAEILEQKGGVDRTLSFKFERFYEYFGGLELFELGQLEPERPAFYARLADLSTQKPYIWGALRNALVRETRSDGAAVLSQLLLANRELFPLQRRRELAVSVLTDLGDEDLAQAEAIAQEYFARAGEAARLPVDIAIETASNLGLKAILAKAAANDDPVSQSLAVNEIAGLFDRDRRASLETLEMIGHNIVRLSLLHPFNGAARQSLFNVSMLIFLRHYHDPQACADLRATLQAIFSKTAIGRLLKNINEVPDMILAPIAGTIARTMLDTTSAGNVDIFKLSPPKGDQAALYRRLVGYINGDDLQGRIQTDLLEAVFTDDWLIVSISSVALIAYGKASPDEAEAFLRGVLQNQAVVKTHWFLWVPITVQNILECHPHSAGLFQIMLETTEKINRTFETHPLNDTRITPAFMLGPRVLCNYKMNGDSQPDWLQALIDEAVTKRDYAFFDQLILNPELPYLGIQRGQPQLALDVLSLVFEIDDPRVADMTRLFLARLMRHFPDEVDDFLDSHHAGRAYRLSLNDEYPEPVGAQVAILGLLFLRDSVIGEQSSLREHLERVLLMLADSKSINEWIVSGVRYVIQLVL